jgi:hypothetical protein
MNEINHTQNDGYFYIEGRCFKGVFKTLYAEYLKENPSKKIIIWLIDRGLEL